MVRDFYTPVVVIPIFYWGSTVLAATYHTLYEAIRRTSPNCNLTVYFLLLWSYKRVYIRSGVDHSLYKEL
jgi:hypothetical protein